MNYREVSPKWTSLFVGAAILSSHVLHPATSLAQPTVIYSTGFEAPEFDVQEILFGQDGWVGTDVNGNGLVEDFFPGQGQQAYVGFFPLTGTNDILNVWRPLDFNPLAAGRPLVKFSVSMAIFDSTTNRYDSFRWSIYNTNNGGTRLFTLDFDNVTTNINYILDDDEFVSTGFVFEKSFSADDARIYDLLVTMNFAGNLWSATLNDVVVVDNKPITTGGSALNLGDIDAVWFYTQPGAPGDNYMVFDDYHVTAEPLPAEPFRLDSLGLLQNNSFSLRLTGEPGRNYAIESSGDLAAWNPIRTNTATDGTFDFVDTTAPESARRYYRARLVP